MPEWLNDWWMFASVAAVVLLLIAVETWRERRRTQGLRDAAFRLGLNFLETDPTLEAAEFRSLPLFQKGHSHRIWNIVRGSDELIFGYRYTTGGGRSSSTHTQTVYASRVAGRNLPRFELKPERLFDRIKAALGGQDIDFEEDPDFSKGYRLQGSDEAEVRRVFGMAVRAQLRTEGGWAIEGDGEWLVVYQRSKRARPDDLTGFLQRMRRIAALFS